MWQLWNMLWLWPPLHLTTPDLWFFRLIHNSIQRWANSVLMTEYEYEYYSTFQKWPNTNTNIIRFEKGDRIRIRILFGLKKATEYEYEYYSVWKNRPNTNTNIIRFEKITRIRIWILFGLKKSPEYEYEYYSVWKNHPNTNTNIIRFENIDRIRIRIFWYSNIIRIIFEYRIIRSPLFCKSLSNN